MALGSGVQALEHGPCLTGALGHIHQNARNPVIAPAPENLDQRKGVGKGRGVRGHHHAGQLCRGNHMQPGSLKPGSRVGNDVIVAVFQVIQCPEYAKALRWPHIHAFLHAGGPRNNMQAVVGLQDDILKTTLSGHHIGKGFSRIKANHNADVGQIGVAIQQQNAVILPCEGERKIQGDRGLAHPTLATRYGDGARLVRIVLDRFSGVHHRQSRSLIFRFSVF